VSSEGGDAVNPRSDVPNFASGVTGSGGEEVGVGGWETHPHHIPTMLRESRHHGGGGDVPEGAGGVARGGDDVFFVCESTAGEVPFMAGQLLGGSNHLGGRPDRVDGTGVVQPTRGH